MLKHSFARLCFKVSEVFGVHGRFVHPFLSEGIDGIFIRLEELRGTQAAVLEDVVQSLDRQARLPERGAQALLASRGDAGARRGRVPSGLWWLWRLDERWENVAQLHASGELTLLRVRVFALGQTRVIAGDKVLIARGQKNITLNLLNVLLKMMTSR